MSDTTRKSEQYRRERKRAELRADGSVKSLIIWAAVGLLGAGGVVLFSILGSIK